MNSRKNIQVTHQFYAIRSLQSHLKIAKIFLASERGNISKSLDLTYKQTGIQQALNLNHTAAKAAVPEEFVQRVLLKVKQSS